MRRSSACAESVTSLGADCIEKPLNDEHKVELKKLLDEAGVEGVRPTSSNAMAPRESSITSTSTTSGPTDERARPLDPYAAAQVRDLR